MKQITLVKKTISSNSGLNTLGKATKDLIDWLEKINEMKMVIQKNLDYTEGDIFNLLYNSTTSRTLLHDYKTERKQFFEKNGYLPLESIHSLSIEGKKEGNIIQFVTDKYSLSDTYLSLNQSSMSNLLNDMDYILIPYDIKKDYLQIMSDEQKNRIQILDEEVMVAIPFKSLQMNYILNSSIEFLQKVQVPQNANNTWTQFMLMFPMFSAMQSQINQLKSELGDTNKRVDSLTNDIQNNFKNINSMFQNHASKINSVINRLDTNTQELDVIHNRHIARKGTGYDRVFTGQYEQVGYGKSTENDWGYTSWSHYYSVPIYEDVPFSFIIPANPTRPIAVLSNGTTIALNVKNPAEKISVDELKKQLSSHCFVFGKDKKNTYRLMYDNINQLSQTTSAFINEVIQFQVK